MDKGRLEAFTDGVVAIIITIMVLELKVPHGATWDALKETVRVFLAYVLSYVNVGVFWNNHHHVLHASRLVDGRVLWTNLFLLFWLSLVPFTIRWIDESGLTALPVAAYGVVLTFASVGYFLLEKALIACNGPTSALAIAVGRDRKGLVSLLLYVASIGRALHRARHLLRGGGHMARVGPADRESERVAALFLTGFPVSLSLASLAGGVMAETIHIGALRFLRSKHDTAGGLDIFEMSLAPNA